MSVFDAEAMSAVDGFRSAQGWALAVSGLVDEQTIDRLWVRLEREGHADEVRAAILEIARGRR